MNYVLAAWGACGALLVAYSARTVRRERALRRALGGQDRK